MILSEFVIFRFLLDNIDELIDNQEHIRILVPLCGKTIDMKW